MFVGEEKVFINTIDFGVTPSADCQMSFGWSTSGQFIIIIFLEQEEVAIDVN